MTIAPTSVESQRAPRRDEWRRVAVVAALMLLAAGLVLMVECTSWRSSDSNSVQGSGVPATQVRELAAFSSVDLAGANNLTIDVGDSQKVTVQGDDNLIALVTTRVQGSRLVVGKTGSFSARAS